MRFLSTKRKLHKNELSGHNGVHAHFRRQTQPASQPASKPLQLSQSAQMHIKSNENVLKADLLFTLQPQHFGICGVIESVCCFCRYFFFRRFTSNMSNLMNYIVPNVGEIHRAQWAEQSERGVIRADFFYQSIAIIDIFRCFFLLLQSLCGKCSTICLSIEWHHSKTVKINRF